MLVALAASSAPPAPLLARPAVELLSLYVRLPNLFSQLSRNGWPALCEALRRTQAPELESLSRWRETSAALST